MAPSTSLYLPSFIDCALRHIISSTPSTLGGNIDAKAASMIMANGEKTDFVLQNEDPPSYDDASQHCSSEQIAADDVGTDKGQSSAYKPPEPARTHGPGTASWKPQSSSSSSSASSSSSSWMRHMLGNSAAKPNGPPDPKSQADLRSTVRGVIRDLVTGSSSAVSLWSGGGVAAMAILDSCALACAQQQVSFASILQERSVENHTPVYWAIIQRPPLADEQPDAILLKLLALSAPLAEHTVHELHIACLVVHSNTILQLARSSPAIFPFSGTDYILVHGSDRTSPATGFRDVVDVVEGEGSELRDAAFSVDLELRDFQKRMRVSKQVQVEFIARGRVWSLVFFVVPSPVVVSYEGRVGNNARIPHAAYAAMRLLPTPLAEGTWACCLSLRAGSPQCWVDGRIVVYPHTGGEGCPDKTAAMNSQPECMLTSGLAIPGSWGGNTVDVAPCQAYSSANPFSPPQRRLNPSISATSLTTSPSSSYMSCAGCDRAISTPVNHQSASGPMPPLTLRLKCTEGALTAPPPPAYETLPLSLIPDSSAEKNSNSEGDSGKKSLKQTLKHADDKLNAFLVRQTEATSSERGVALTRCATAPTPTCIVAGLGEGAGWFGDGEGMGKLMYDNCPYIAHDGALRATFEAKLGKPGPECIIC